MKSNLKESFAVQEAGEQGVIGMSAPQIYKPILIVPLSTLTITQVTDSDSIKFCFFSLVNGRAQNGHWLNILL